MKTGRIWFSFLTLVFFLVFSIQIAIAEEEDATKTSENEVVVTAERSPDALADAPRAISVVTGQEILENTSRTVPEALKYEEGVMIQRTNLGGGSPFIRGLKGNEVLLLVDGIRMNNSLYRGGPNQYLNTIDPFFIDRIEVVRGPSSVLYGSDALGGVVNVITKRRGDYSSMWDVDGRIMSQFSSAEGEQTGHMGLEGNVGTYFGITASGNIRRFGEIDPGGNAPLQEPNAYREQDIAANADLNFGDHVVWEFSAQHVNLDEVPKYEPGVYFQMFDPQTRDLFYSKVHLLDLSQYLDRIVLFGSYNRQLEGRVKYEENDDQTSLIQTEDEDIAKTWGGGLQIESPIGRWVRFVAGGEFYHDTIVSTRGQGDWQGELFDADPQYPDDSKYMSAAGYFEARFTPFNWMKVVPGVRYSYFAPDIVMEDPTLGEVTVDDPIDDVTWAFHSLLKPSRYQGFILGVSRGFRVPSIDDLTKLGEEDDRFDVPNSELDPVTLIQYELGYRISHPKAFVSLFAYYSDIEDKITRKPATYEGQDEINGKPVYHNENVGEAYIYGGEFAAKLVPVEDFLSLGGTMSYTFGQNETDDEPLRRIPPLMGNAWMRVTVKPVWIEGGLEAAAAQDRLSSGDKDDYRIGQDPRLPGDETPAYTVYNIRVGMAPASWMDAVFAVENIMDVKYKTHGSWPYEAGRNFKGQVSIKF